MDCVFLTVKIGHRLRYIFADVKVNTEISNTPQNQYTTVRIIRKTTLPQFSNLI